MKPRLSLQMKGFYSVCLATILLSALSTHATRVIELTKDNHIALYGQVTSSSMGQLAMDMGNLLAHQTAQNVTHPELFINIYSGGGSVNAGNQFINQIEFAQHRNVTVNCVVDMAASMAFTITQACDTRYVTTSSLLMQHQISSYGMGGPVENLKSSFDRIEQLVKLSNQRDAARLNMTLDDFQTKIAHDWWLYGENAVRAGAADELAVVGCHPSLYQSTHNVTVQTWFGPVTLVMSDCPLITAPLKVAFERNLSPAQKNQAFEELRNHITVDPYQMCGNHELIHYNKDIYTRGA